ncbi:MAG: hypothetical protein LQ340_004326 [Diploschistes diacapsis]|nr:MAG: hypothetical protein LQ340_004326 [Diploschistes diacapsis]
MSVSPPPNILNITKYSCTFRLRSLTIILEDVEVFLSTSDITKDHEKNLCGITAGCQSALEDLEKKQNEYSSFKSQAEGIKGRVKRVWKRLAWEPEDIRDLRSRITSNIALLNSFTNGFIRNNVGKLVQGQDQQEHRELLDWLTPIDFSAQQSDFICRRQPDTGQWLLDSAEYRHWITAKSETLVCPGIPGAGKTILTSIVVDNLCNLHRNDNSVGICYIYCNFRRKDEQTLKNLMASLLRQLAQGQPVFPEYLKDLYQRHKQRGTRPSVDEICRTLHSVATGLSRVFVVIDALDECQISDGCRSRFISELLDLHTRLGANVLVTSRFIPEITKSFENTVSLEIRASNEDIGRYLNGNLSNLPHLVSTNAELQEEIKESITKCVDGMLVDFCSILITLIDIRFLLARLHLDSLRGKRSPKAVRVALKKLVERSDTYDAAYDAAYDDAMERIQSQLTDQKVLALETLSWITCAKRPLTTTELRHALSVELYEPELDEDNLLDLQDMVSSCCGLVTIDEESDIIRLVHYTTQEYFERTQTSWFPDAQSEIASICATYLSFQAFECGMCGSDEEFEKRLSSYPLYDYASHYWGFHAYQAPDYDKCPAFLTVQSKVNACSQVLLAKRRWPYHPEYSRGVPRQMTGLHLAAFFGLLKVVINLLDSQDLNQSDRNGKKALSYAAESGNKAVVQLLLDRGADIETTDHNGWTALYTACIYGKEAVVQLLLDRGADIKTTNKDGGTALISACDFEQEAVVQLLLDRGADIETTDHIGWTALLSACLYGEEAVVQLLLDRGADIEATDKRGMTALLYAARSGQETVVQLLLDRGADINKFGETAPLLAYRQKTIDRAAASRQRSG